MTLNYYLTIFGPSQRAVIHLSSVEQYDRSDPNMNSYCCCFFTGILH